jgi:hypothetical protein
MKYDIEEFCCEDCFADSLIEAMFDVSKLKDDDYSSVCVICKEDLAEKLLKIFANIEVDGFDFNIEYLNFDKADYDKEYAVIIDTDGSLSVDKVYFDDGELQTFGEDLVFISDECNSKVLINQVSFDEDAVHTFSFEDEEDEFDDEDFKCDGDCENCELNGNEDFDDEFEDDEFIDLYSLVEGIVEDILGKKFSN